jgi:hypothetical protein
LRTSLRDLQKQCEDSAGAIGDRLKKLDKSLKREQLLSDSVKFTTNTLSEFDDINPPVLDIIFEYKLKDSQMQAQEAQEIARVFKQRDMDPERKVINKLERE